jgi:Ca2+-binding EF-hand superfamily protein
MENTEKIDLEELISSYKVTDKEAFKLYLKDIWNDLSQRTKENNITGISKITFSSYYELPGIISDRLFNVLDESNVGFLKANDFIKGMTTLFCEEFEVCCPFIFNFYDFDKDGQISKEDIRTVLSYVSLSQEIQNYKDRVHSQKELYEILEICFSKIKGDKMNYIKFKNVIENESSDIYLMILLFLYEKKPFTKITLMSYIKKTNKESPTNSPKLKSPKKLVASPSRKNYSFSPYQVITRQRRRTMTVKGSESVKMREMLNQSDENVEIKRRGSRVNTIGNDSVIKLVPTPKVHSKFKEHSSNPYPNTSGNNEETYSPVHRKKKRNLKNLTNSKNVSSKFSDNKNERKDKKRHSLLFTEAAMQPVFKQSQSNNDNQNEMSKSSSGESTGIIEPKNNDGKDEILIFDDFEDEENSDEEEKENIVTFEGYLIKVVEKKMRKIWFKLIGRDLFYFKNNKEELHKGMHHLSGIFIQEEKPKIFNGKKYLSFSMIYPKKTRVYYCEKENEYKIWIEKLKIATGFTNLTDIYDIGEKIGNGKFGLIKKGTNKKTGMQVAIKIMSKKDMTNQDLELVRTEIEILKICQHPNIIQLYEVFENLDYFYIIMEYCSGGDLFSYLECRDFHLPEPLACKFMHKICAALYYIHSYGIAHRDLKPENVLMTTKDENADLRILDFGLSKIIGPDEKCNEPFGTLSYVAPEVLLDSPYGKEVDLWSIGVMTYLMLGAALPFDDRDDEEEIARKTCMDDPPFKGSIWKKISKEGIDFIKKLLQKKPEKRMNIKEALEHEWFHKFDNTKVVLARRDYDKKENAFELYTNPESLKQNLGKK